MDSLLRLIEESDELIPFFAQCPAGKRGRPLGAGSAVAMEKANPGSVCAKEASARRGLGRVGARTVFYRMKTYSDKLRERLEKERAKKEREAIGAFEEPKDIKDNKKAIFPVLYKKIKGGTHKQIGASKTLIKEYRNRIRELSNAYPKQGKFFTEAWRNLHKLGKPGDILERKGLPSKHLILTLLSRPSIKALSKVFGIDITKKNSKVFDRIMLRFFKDDEDYNIDKEKQKQAENSEVDYKEKLRRLGERRNESFDFEGENKNG